MTPARVAFLAQRDAEALADQRAARLARGECWCHGEPILYCPSERVRIEGNFFRGLGSQLVWVSL